MKRTLINRRSRRRLGRLRARSRTTRRGAGLIEVLIAISIFALIATSHAAVTLRYATRMKEVKIGATRSAALQEYLVRLAAVPFDSLNNRVGCVTTTTGDLPNTRCISVTTVTSLKVNVVLILTPTNTAYKPDTITMTRTKVVNTSPIT
jgi:prepilin-type N-terminal cleavage/methylation domain-containing protein